MTDLERLAEILKSNRMAKEHEDYGFPRGWNEAMDFVLSRIGTLRKSDEVNTGQASHGKSRTKA